MKVSKDGGQTFYEIGDEPEEQKTAMDKGYKPYVEVTKNGTERFTIEGSPEEMHKAESKGYNTVEAHENLSRYPARTPYSKTASAAQGLTSGLMMDFDDEASGGIAGAKAYLKDKDPFAAYRSQRDAYRQEKGKAQADNPWSYGGASLVGSMAFPGGAAVKGGRLGQALATGAKAGAIGGAVQGVGNSEELGDTVGDAAFGAGVGGLTGGVAGGLFRGALRPSRTASDLKELATETIPGYMRAMMGGAKETGKAMNESFGSVGSVVGAPIGAVKGVRDQARKASEFKGLVDQSRLTGESVPSYDDLPTPAKQPLDVEFHESPGIQIKEPPPRRPQISDDVTDKEYVARMMLEPGPSKIKEFYADKGASQFPGQLRADSYNKLLEMGVEGRTKARAFNRDEHGAELLPDFQESRKVFKDARNERFGELQGRAASQYEGSDDILIHIGDAIEDAGSTNETKSIQGLLHDIQNKVAAGKGNKRQGLTPGNWDEVDGAEKFNRLQKAREQLYSKKLYAKQNGLSEAEHILQDLVEKIDRELKFSPDKVEADRVYSKAKGLDKSMFNKTDFEGGIDKYKIAGMLKNTDSAKRFRDNIGRFEEFVNDPSLNPQLKASGQKLLDRFRAASDTAEQQRALNDFRFANGPSSAAIERQTAIMGGPTNPLAEAVRAPSGFMNAADEFAKSRSQRFFGKPFQSLSPSEKDTLVKVWFWEKKNPSHTREQLEKYFAKVRK